MKRTLYLLLAGCIASCNKSAEERTPGPVTSTPGSMPTAVSVKPEYPYTEVYKGQMQVEWWADYPTDSFDTSYLAYLSVRYPTPSDVDITFRYTRRQSEQHNTVQLDQSARFTRNATGSYQAGSGKSSTLFTFRNDSLLIYHKIYNKTFMNITRFGGKLY